MVLHFLLSCGARQAQALNTKSEATCSGLEAKGENCFFDETLLIIELAFKQP